MPIKLISFGYKSGDVPAPAGEVIDCRKLRNPHHVETLRMKTGLDKEVQDFVDKDPKCFDLVNEAFAKATSDAVIAFGCYGGRHRSVAVVELVAKSLRAAGLNVWVRHRDLRP
jgi:UPF0042 nucleotide-binding protein